MKHTIKVTLILISIFLATQLFGLYTTSKYIDFCQDENDSHSICFPETTVGKAPEVEKKSISFVYILFAILIGTALLLLLIKLKVRKFWKSWFFLSVFITMAITFGVYVNKFIALIAAIVLAILKVYKRNFYIHNFTEIFIYTGIVVLFIPILNLFSVVFLLIFISIYDYIAVFKSKHMIKLAKYQSKEKVFAGLVVPYVPKKGIILSSKKSKKTASKKIIKKDEGKSAILGGGDIAFPLLFSAVSMIFFIEHFGISKISSLLFSYIISLTTTIFLFVLLYYGKKDKFYPAMPIISAGCLLGFGIVFLLIKVLI